MKKIKEIIIGTNNEGKYREISNLIPKEIKRYSPKELNILSPPENGSTFRENSVLKASYFSKKTNLICLSDDSGLEIDLLNGLPGIFSSRWSGPDNNFDIAIKKVFEEMNKVKKYWLDQNSAQFVCCLTVFWPQGKSYSVNGIVRGKISNEKKGKRGFGYDPIFIPNGYNKTFGQLNPKIKMSIDHRYNAFLKIKNFFS